MGLKVDNGYYSAKRYGPKNPNQVCFKIKKTSAFKAGSWLTLLIDID